MASSQYHFVTRWRVVGTVDEISEILEKPEDLPRWWPSVYLEAERLTPADEQGVGSVLRMLTKGFLPYTLSWQLRVAESRRPRGFTIEAAGDFVGRGVWTFEQEGAWVDVTFDWRISVEKPGVKELSPLLKPVFAANHRWAMRRGEESLKVELERRRAEAQGRHPSAAPPPATTTSPWPLLLAGVALLLLVVAGASVLARPRRRRRRLGWRRRSR
jgi:hypothetical protein